MDFFINVGSTKPMLMMELINDGRNDYNNFYDMIQNADIKFSMYDAETGVKKISMQPAKCVVKDNCCDGTDEEYYIAYEWRTKDTKKTGTYVGQFTINFLDGGGILKVPIREELMIHIKDGYIKK